MILNLCNVCYSNFSLHKVIILAKIYDKTAVKYLHSKIVITKMNIHYFLLYVIV